MSTQPATYEQAKDDLLDNVSTIFETLLEKSIPRIVELVNAPVEKKKQSTLDLMELVKTNMIDELKKVGIDQQSMLGDKEKEIMTMIENRLLTFLNSINAPEKWIEAASLIDEGANAIVTLERWIRNRKISTKELIGLIMTFSTIAALIVQLINQYGII